MCLSNGHWSHLIGPSISILELDVGLLPDAVQVLVKAIEEEGQKLMGVLLLVARELRGKAAHLGLDDGNANAYWEKNGVQSNKNTRKMFFLV